MKKIKEEVCVHYMGFGICAKGLHTEGEGGCAGCIQYEASGVKNERKREPAIDKAAESFI